MRYDDVRLALEREPRSWTLIDGVDLEAEVPEFPVSDVQPQQAAAEPTPSDVLRDAAMQAAVADPGVLVRAVATRLLTQREAEELLRRYWGDGVTLKDFGGRR